MKRLTTRAGLAAWRAAQPGTVGLVPTMGALHEGHLALVRRAAAENHSTLATIFVNPAQFDDAGDLAAYPRDPDRDAELLAASGCDALFEPPVAEIYPPGFDTWVEVGAVGERLEGASRPGHFRGVATIVAKLFALTRPTRAYFGQKDAQQLAVVRRMTADLDLGVEVVGCPTVREPDGLAMSSRNRRLDDDARRAATHLYEGLSAARAAWRDGERDAAALRQTLVAELAHPAIEIDYVSVADPTSLAELETVDGGALVSLAAFVGGIRLIDNLSLPARLPRQSRPRAAAAIPLGEPQPRSAPPRPLENRP